MRKIEILLNEEHLVPGGKVEGYVLVTCDDDFHCEKLYLSLFGEELTQVIIHAGKVTIVYKEDRVHVDETREIAECLMIPMGESRYEFSFTLPRNIPGSYNGSYAWIKYILKAKAEISWARDLKSKRDLDVKFESSIDSEHIRSGQSESLESDGIILLRVEIERDRFLLADKIDFRFFVDREANMRGVRAELVRIEHVEPKGHKTDSKITLAEVYFNEEEIRRDSWSESTIPIDDNLPESFKTELIECSYVLKVTLDIALRKDKTIEIPIVIQGRDDRYQSEFSF